LLNKKPLHRLDEAALLFAFGCRKILFLLHHHHLPRLYDLLTAILRLHRKLSKVNAA